MDLPLRLLPPLVPVFESQNFLDVQPIFACPAILRYRVDQHTDFWRRGMPACRLPITGGARRVRAVRSKADALK